MEADSIGRFFQEYEDTRKAFVKTCADLAAKPEHLSALRAHAALELLFPLLLDPVALVRQVATLAIGRLSQRDEACARSVSESPEAFPRLVGGLLPTDPVARKAGLVALRHVVQWSRAHAVRAVDAGVLGNLLLCLEDADVGVREKTLWLLGDLAKSPEAAEAIWDEGALPLIAAEYCGPEESLRPVALHALYAVAQHSPHRTVDVFECNATLPGRLVQDVRLGGPTARVLATAVLAEAAQVPKLAGSVAPAQSIPSLSSSNAYPALATALSDPEDNARFHAAKALAKAIATADRADTEVARLQSEAKAMGERAVEDAHVQAQKLRDDAAAKGRAGRDAAARQGEGLRDDAAAKGRAVPEVEAKRLLEAADAKAAALRDDADARAARLVQKAEQKKAELSDDASGVSAVKDFLDNVAKVAARPLMQVLPVPGAARVQALLAVGRLAAFSQATALELVRGGGAAALREALADREEHVQAAAAHAAGRLAEQGPAVGQELLAVGVLGRLIHMRAGPAVMEEVRRARAVLVDNCDSAEALAQVLEGAPRDVAADLLARLGKVLENRHEKKAFVRAGGLAMLPRLEPALDGPAQKIKALYDDATLEWYVDDRPGARPRLGATSTMPLPGQPEDRAAPSGGDPKTLVVTVVQARDVVKKDMMGYGASDPYCKLSLGGKEQTTKVIDNTRNPVWNEQFHFKFTGFQDVLNVELRDKDVVASEFLGDLKVPLDRLRSQKRIEVHESLANVKEGSIELVLEVAY